jgi:hypothetical protein
VLAFSEKFYYVQETTSFYCWEYKQDKTISKLYIPKWRVPEPTPTIVNLSVGTHNEFEENKITERDILRNPQKKNLPIIVLAEKKSDHQYTVRFDINNYNKQINSLYIPYSFLEANLDIEKVTIKIEWE